jgi:ribosomal protein L29
MRAEDYKGWNIDQVRARYKELKRELFDQRIKSGVNQLQDYSKLKKTKKAIAKLLTYAKREGFSKIR